MIETNIIKECEIMFARFGIPEYVRSDDRSQFQSEFEAFGKQYDFKHITSSSYYSQSNGCIEKSVKIAKKIS